MANAKKATKTGTRAHVGVYTAANGARYLCSKRPAIYKSATGARIVKVQGIWTKLLLCGGRRHPEATFDLSKPYVFPTRNYKSHDEKRAEKIANRAEAVKAARKVLSKKHLRALGLSK